MDKRKTNNEIKALSKKMFSRKQQNLKGYTLVLGAGASISSGCPSFRDLCVQFCDAYEVEVVSDDPISTVKEYVLNHAKNKIDIYAFFSEHLKNKVPSIGYRHLANLVKQGYFSTIITTNYDCLLENALINLMGLDDIKIYIRGEMNDEDISSSINLGLPKVNIIKLHGDLTSGVFFITDEDTAKIGDKLKELLGSFLSKGCIIVGSDMKDIDLLGALLHGNCEEVIYVNPKSPRDDPAINSALLSLGNKSFIPISCTDKREDGKFDVFFSDLDIEVQRNYVFSDDILKKQKSIENSIIKTQEKGTGYINYSTLTNLVEDYVRKIKSSYDPDCLIFINDPSAPGGMELRRRLLPLFKKLIIGEDIFTILIEGQNGSRTHKREVKSPKNEFDNILSKNHQRILVLDSITFSGNTMIMALEKLKEWFPNRNFKPGVLILDESLEKEIQTKLDHPLKEIIYERLTDRHEIFFPWGVTQATKECLRSFRNLDDNDYMVRIARKPWGSIEVLAEEKYCSVRILTIEANCSYSFQRHLCRDEFFVSLDDNIGLEISCKKLTETDLKKYNSFNDVPYIKSLVLEKGDYILVPRGLWHRFKASKERVRLLEIGYGVYDEDIDIERRVDPYGRENQRGVE